ncbi:MAG: hypothetical protein OXF93_05765, partial [Acidobacteria bacterium]|nr:hypothetical protein [Acidobacteriota bacterium]
QAAVAIANARAFRDERRARADLEALVDTSPAGVVVFDAATAHPGSLNREARRIVERLRQPGHTTEDLLNVVTCRRADGRELALGEFPLATALRSAETVPAEEIVLSVPDGPASPPCSAPPPCAATAGPRPSWSRFRTSPRSRERKLMVQVPALAELPVVFISAYGRDETIARALDAGADDYLS